MRMALENINSADIISEARRRGISKLKYIGNYRHPDHPDSSDWDIGIFEIPDGGRVATTNGDPVWEEADPGLFAEMLEEYQIP